MPAVDLLHITKRFGNLLALDAVTLHLAPARVHGLLGENGAGKTTLMNVLYGLLRPDTGEIQLDGRRISIHTPHDAIAAGIGMVHQHFMLAEAMTVLDNVLLGDRRQGQWLDRRFAVETLRELGDHVGLPIDPSARIADLSVGQQQRVEILKALYRDVRLLILDEPTAVLTPAETAQLFAAVERLRAEGKSVVFISHKLAEVKRICDDLTVLRRGRVVWEGLATAVTDTELSRHMIGREVRPIALHRPEIEGITSLAPVNGGEGGGEGPSIKAALIGAQNNSLSPVPRGEGGGEGSDVSAAPIGAVQPKTTDANASRAKPDPPTTPHPHPLPWVQGRGSRSRILVLDNITTGRLRAASLELNRGEIIGVAGVDGNGQQELAEVIVGLRIATTGRVVICERDVTAIPIGDKARPAVAHIPNDRKREGLIASMTVTENLLLKQHARHPFASSGMISWKRGSDAARELMTSFDIRAASADTPVGTLSGGNQQKVILARELAMTQPDLIVAMNPARGLDVAATSFVYEQLLARRAAGCGVLLISSELDELLALSDRIAVLYNGRLTMSDFPTAGVAEIGRMMTGA